MKREENMKHKLAGSIVAVVTMLSVCMTAFADNQNGVSLISRFDRSFSILDSLIFSNGQRGKELTTVDAINGFGNRQATTISPQLDKALKNQTAAVIKEGNGKTGLSLTGQAYYRIAGNGGIDDVAGETGNALYKAKFQAELRWAFLQSSLFGRNGRRREAELEEQIARAGYEKGRIDINEYTIKASLAEHYDSLMAGVLSHRVAMLRLLDDAQHYLLGTENISSDELVNVLNERMEAERKLTEIERDYPAARTLAGIEATTVKIDSTALIKYVADSQGDMKILQLRMELLEQREKNIKWWQTWNVAPFVRYAHYFRGSVPDTYNLDAGIAFTIPLDGTQCLKKKTLRSERAVLEAETERLSRRVADKTAIIVDEVNRLNRASAAEVRRMDEIKRYLSVRTDAYERGYGEHNRLARAKEYVMYLSCLERLIEYQYRRDALVADLQTLLPDETILRFCSFRNLDITSTRTVKTPQY